MNLTAEQIEELKREIKEKRAFLDQLHEDAKGNLSKRLAVAKELNALTDMLIEAVTLTSNNDDVIGLGSKFSATIEDDFETTTEDYLISDSNIKVPGFVAITSDSPFAKAVMGKRANDNFAYNVKDYKVKGLINQVYKSEKEIGNQKTIGTIN